MHLYLEVFEGRVGEAPAVGNIISDNAQECSGEEIVAINQVGEQYLYEFGRLGKKMISDDEKSNE